MRAASRQNEIHIEQLNKSYAQQTSAGDLHYIIQDVNLAVKAASSLFCWVQAGAVSLRCLV